MPYNKTCDDGGYVHSPFRMLLVFFFSIFQPSSFAALLTNEPQKVDVAISLMQSILGMIFLAWTLPWVTK
jgi:hypothetical protein